MTEAKQELLRIAAELLTLDADISALNLELRALWDAGTGPDDPIFMEKYRLLDGKKQERVLLEEDWSECHWEVLGWPAEVPEEDLPCISVDGKLDLTGHFIEKRTQDLCGRRPQPSRPTPQVDQAPPQASLPRQAEEP